MFTDFSEALLAAVINSGFGVGVGIAVGWVATTGVETVAAWVAYSAGGVTYGSEQLAKARIKIELKKNNFAKWVRFIDILSECFIKAIILRN
jgi:hypothetical protein